MDIHFFRAHRRHRICTAVLLALVCVFFGRLRLTAMEGGREHTLKAGFLINFGQFTTWPRGSFPSDKSPFVIGIIGPDPFGEILDAVVRGVNVGGRPIEIRRISSSEDVRGCHLLFVGALQPRDLRRIVESASALPVLTVGDGDAFLAAGGMVAFRVDNNRVRFDINPDATRRASLVVSSEMLQFARLVKP